MSGHRATVLVPALAHGESSGMVHAGTSIGVLTVATTLKEAGEDVFVVDPEFTPGDVSEDEAIACLAEQILAHDPEVVGFSTTCGLYALTLLVAKECKKRSPSSTIILGGPQASATWRETLEKCAWVDMVAVGETDLSVRSLWQNLGNRTGLKDVPGVAFRDHESIFFTGDAERPRELDVLPIPDFRLLPPSTWRDERYLPIEAGRGCPFHCGFCSTSSFWGRRNRLKSADRVVQEMHAASDQVDWQKFRLLHDSLTENRRLVVEICERLEKDGAPFQWVCSSRLDSLDDDLLERMASAGCDRIYVGVESASERLRSLIGKPIDLTRTTQGLRRIRESGIVPVVSFIFGFPDETEAELLESLALALEIRFELGARVEFRFSPLAPVPETDFLRRYEALLDIDRFSSPRFHVMPFSAPRCEEFAREHRELCVSAYHYRTTYLSHDHVFRAAFLLTQLIGHVDLLELLRRALGAELPEALYRHLPAFRPDGIRLLHDLDLLERRTEQYLEALMAQCQAPIAYWRDLYRYEAALLRFNHLSSELRAVGISVELTHDVRPVGERLTREEGVPTLAVSPRRLRLWCVEIDGKAQVVDLPPDLAEVLESDG